MMPMIIESTTPPNTWVVPTNDSRFGQRNSERDGDEFMEIGVFLESFGLTSIAIGLLDRKKRMVKIGMVGVLAGSYITVVGAMNNLSGREVYVERTPINTDVIIPSVTEYFFPEMRSPTPSVTIAPSITPSPTETMLPTETATVTATSVPPTPSVNLDDALATCHHPGFPSWLRSIYVRKQIGFNPPTEDCFDMSLVDEGEVILDFSIAKTDGVDYSSHSFINLYVPFTLQPGQDYLISVLDCDDECVVALRDAGDVVVGREIHTSMVDPVKQFIVQVDGYSEGFIVVGQHDVGGGSSVKISVKPITK